jgi:D-alanyl-D-alanine dipeptidase
MKKALFILLSSCIIPSVFAQSVGIGTSAPDASARLDINSSSQGILIPRLSSAQRVAIAHPATGLLVFQTDGARGFCYYNGLTWINLSNDSPINSEGFSSLYGSTTTLAGSGSPGGANGPGATASFNLPTAIATDASGNLYVADESGNRIRKITPAAVVTTLAGSGTRGAADGTGTAASFYAPGGVATDALGNIYVADQGNNKIRKITPAGVVTTFAGSGAPGDMDATGTAASFYDPRGLATDVSGNLYVGDRFNHKIKKITPSGVVTTLAGSGIAGSADGTGAAASFNSPTGIATDISGNIYVADQDNHCIRKITPNGTVTTLAGSGMAGSADGTGTAASFNFPRGIAADITGNVYVADEYNNKIRKITPAGVVTTLAGSGASAATDGNSAAAAFWGPRGVATDVWGNLYVADAGNNKIRKIIAY